MDKPERKVGTLILSSLLEDLVLGGLHGTGTGL